MLHDFIWVANRMWPQNTKQLLVVVLDVLSLGYTGVLLWRNSVNFVRCGVQIDLIPHDTHRIVGYVYLKTWNWKRSKQQ